MAINPLAPKIYMRRQLDFPNPSGVFKSTDGGMTWSKTGW